MRPAPTDFSRPVRRWTKRRKREFIRLVDRFVDLDIARELLTFHDVSSDELAHWRLLLAAHGLDGLAVNTIQAYRNLHQKG